MRRLFLIDDKGVPTMKLSGVMSVLLVLVCSAATALPETAHAKRKDVHRSQLRGYR